MFRFNDANFILGYVPSRNFIYFPLKLPGLFHSAVAFRCRKCNSLILSSDLYNFSRQYTSICLSMLGLQDIASDIYHEVEFDFQCFCYTKVYCFLLDKLLFNSKTDGGFVYCLSHKRELSFTFEANGVCNNLS